MNPVQLGMAQPARSAAADDVGADHAVITGQRPRQVVEIIRDAGHAVHTNEHIRIIGCAPFLVCHAVQAGRGKALNRLDFRFDHADSFIKFILGGTINGYIRPEPDYI